MLLLDVIIFCSKMKKLIFHFNCYLSNYLPPHSWAENINLLEKIYRHNQQDIQRSLKKLVCKIYDSPSFDCIMLCKKSLNYVTNAKGRNSNMKKKTINSCATSTWYIHPQQLSNLKKVPILTKFYNCGTAKFKIVKIVPLLWNGHKEKSSKLKGVVP